MLLDTTQIGDMLHVAYYDKNGVTKFKKYKLKDEDLFNWQVAKKTDKKKDPTLVNWDKRPIKKVPTKFINNYRIVEYIENKIPREDYEEIFEYNMPRTYFVDIENVIIPGLTIKEAVERADGEITAISITGDNHKCMVLGTKELTREQIVSIQKRINKHFEQFGAKFEFSFKKFDTEYDLLYTFFAKMVSKFPMMSGWNVLEYDWAYMINRAKKIGIDPVVASPLHKLNGREKYPAGVCILDYMEIYKKWDRSIEIKEDFKLDTAGRDVIGIKKVKYNGTLNDLYRDDLERFYFYNAIDTCLVCLIHEKIKTMEIALTIAHLSHINIMKCASPLAVTETLLCMEFLKNNKVMAIDPDKLDTDEGYEGAFVKEPVVGKHKVVACFDYASLYPSTMRQMNISPENFVKKIPLDKIEEELKKGEYIVSVTGCCFEKEISVLKTILNRLYGQRKSYKKEMFNCQLKKADLEKKLEKLKKEA